MRIRIRSFFGRGILWLFLISFFSISGNVPATDHSFPQLNPTKVEAIYSGKVTGGTDHFILYEKLEVINNNKEPLIIGNLYFYGSENDGKVNKYKMKENDIRIHHKEIPPGYGLLVYEEIGFHERKNLRKKKIRIAFDSNAGEISSNMITYSLGRYIGPDREWLKKSFKTDKVMGIGEIEQKMNDQLKGRIPGRR